MAMERAIREIISPVVDRSVTIACMTTRELVIKVLSLRFLKLILNSLLLRNGTELVTIYRLLVALLYLILRFLLLAISYMM